MNGQMQSKLIGIFLIIVVFIMVSSLIRGTVIFPHLDKSDVCKFEHGGDWRYEETKYFGNTCIKVDYVALDVLDRVAFNLTWKEIYNKYCDKPSFFELSKWDDRCREWET